MRMYDIIIKKRNGEKLTKQEIDFVISGYVSGEIPDYQMSALLMAIYFNGMDKEEVVNFTESMKNSGKVFNLKEIFKNKPIADKHSTGGVGDGVSLSLAPIVASCGVIVPMISGRGLGHTGGTLDKLESIPNLTVNLTEEQFIKQLEKIGVAIISQTEELVPADKKIYALRDTTATIDSVPLIAASIMSKKLAEGTTALLLDVKTGNGAFMEKTKDAIKLAKTMVDIGKSCGVKTQAIITDMNQPLGEYVGNALEVYQAIQILKNNGPKDITQLVIYESAKLLQLVGITKNFEQAKNIVCSKISTGEALEKFKQLVEFQNGDTKIFDNPEVLINTKYCKPIVSEKTGYVTYINTKLVGSACCVLGAGREKITDKIDHSVGFRVVKKLNDFVKKGEPLLYVYYNDETKFEQVQQMIISAYKISKNKTKKLKLVYKEIK